MVKCTACETQNPDDFKFCGNCGERLNQISCQACSHLNLRDMKFCEECGAHLDILICPSCNHENPLEFKFCEECGEVLEEHASQTAQKPHPAKAPIPADTLSSAIASLELPMPQAVPQPVLSPKEISTPQHKRRSPGASIVVRQLPRRASVWTFLFKTALRAFVGSALGFLGGKLGVWLLNSLFSLFFV